MIDLRFVPIEKWPGEPTKHRETARFRATYRQTLDQLEHELGKLHAKEITVQAFFTLDQIRNDGWPYSNAKPSAPGVIISFRRHHGVPTMDSRRGTSKDETFSFPCDRYHTIDDNLRAVALSLEALRAVDRYGVTRQSEQYTGWKQIEAPASGPFRTKEDAAGFMIIHAGHERIDTAKVITDADFRQMTYRDAARRLHPDNGTTGNEHLFTLLQQANSLLGLPG